jgi:hypothetical protein
MKLVHRIVVAAVLAWLGSSGLALAEPISITSGVISLTRDPTTSVPMTLSGTDGVRSFAFNGLLEGDLSYGAHTCDPCGATATDFSIAIPAFSASHGDVTYGSESYTVERVFDDGELHVFILGRAPLPPSPPAVGDVATVTAPFTMTGALFPPFGSGGRANTLVGSGVATLELFVDSSGSQGPAWTFHSGEYRFTAADPGPVPEPATILLCGSGLAFAALRRRRKANGTNI